MVDINPNASSLQAQLQAQLQAGRTNSRPVGNGVDLTPRPQDLIEERIKARGDERDPSRQLPVKRDQRLSELSSQQELEQAQERVNQVASNTREAPAGRTSVRDNELRNQPLGQIVDIRV